MRLALPLLQEQLLWLRYELAGDGGKAEEVAADEREREGLLLQAVNCLTRAKLLSMVPVSPDCLLPLPIEKQWLLHEALLACFSSSSSRGSSKQSEGCLQEALREGRSKSCDTFVVYPFNL